MLFRSDAAAGTILDHALDEYVPREALAATLDPTESVASRDSAGGPAPDAVSGALADAREVLAADEATLADRRDRLATAEDALSKEVSVYV